MSAELDSDRLQRAGQRWDERLASFPGPARAADQDVDSELAEWRRRLDPDNAGLFERRLSWAGLTDADVKALLAGLPDESTPPAWWSTFTWLIDAAGDDDERRPDEAWLATVDARLPDAAREVPFIHLLWPLVEASWIRIADAEPAVSVLSAQARTDACVYLASRLADLAAPSLVRGLAARRSVGQSFLLAISKETNLSSASGRGEYAALCRRQAQTGWADVLSDVPVLARLLAVCVDQWSQVIAELVRRVAADAIDLARVFTSTLPVHIERLQMGAGDAHRGGRTVCLLRLAAPDGPVRVIYKPRDLRLEEQYHRLARWFIADDALDIEVLTRADADGERYGYVTHVQHLAAEPDRLPEFYRNAGRLTALLHLLGATDAHQENLVAHGTTLVLIDPETLFEARLRDGGETSAATVARARDITTSVLRLGLLPRWRLDGLSPRATDISALGSEHPLVGSPVMQLGWRAVNTDAMSWGPRAIQAPVIHSLPVMPGRDNPLSDYVDDLVNGFDDGYRAILDPAVNAELRARLQAFHGLPRRIVARDTLTYAKLMHQATSPTALSSANARAFELDRLSRGALVADDRDVRWPIFLAEVRDLENLDVPYFDHLLGSRTLRGTGGLRIREALVGDGWQAALERIEDAHEADLHWQVSLIRASVATRSTRMSVDSAPAVHAEPMGDGATKAEALDWILQRIDAESVDESGRRNWLTLSPIGDGTQVQLDLMRAGFYSGASGLLTFLGELAAHGPSDETRQRAHVLADEGWASLRASLLEVEPYESHRQIRDIGLGFSGAGGLLRALAQPTCVLDDDARIALRRRIIDALLSGLIEQDQLLDVMSGAAGAIGPLVELAHTDAAAGEAVRRLTDHLRTRQHPNGGWVTPIAARGLTGYSHGASGFALALARAALALDDEQALESALRALEYERSQFDPAHGNWRDLRNSASTLMVAWCHGATGIALARSQLLRLMPDHEQAERWYDELSIAITTTVEAPPRNVDHLCCGNAGRAAALAGLGFRHDVPRARERAEEITHRLLQRHQGALRFRLHDSNTGAAIGQASLMTGLAGIGLHLLAQDSDHALLDLLA